ncbi:MAG TPA: hypothetical protein VLT45_19210 [Kofleriaceae bacterium]|nr:hypothetical protein [Kofleriaceae bacterium]
MWKDILIAQLVVPLALGIPLLIWGDSLLGRRKRDDDPLPTGSAAGAKRLEPLQCPHCSAPVPLHREPFPCPSCGETVTPPNEYVQMLDSRAKAMATLARAERRWRWSRVTSSWPFAGAVLLASIAWFVLVVIAVFEAGWGRGPDIVLLITAAFMSGAGVVGAYALLDAGDKLPPLPARDFMHAPAAAAICRHCSAPIKFAEDQLALICPYCGGDNYRETLARAEELDAATRAYAATRSLLDADDDLKERRDWVFSIIATGAVVELLYGTFVLYGYVSDWVSNWWAHA